MENQKVIPEGYMEKADGNLVPVDKVKAIDKARDEIVKEIVEKGLGVAGEITRFKDRALGDIQAFVQMSAETHGVNIGGDKGNVTLCSFDGKYKVKRSIADNLVFDEQLQVAKALIDECIHEWSEGGNTNLRVLVNDAFQVDKEGCINTGRVLGLRRLDIADEKWLKAMKVIGESLWVAGSKTYINIYKKGKNNRWEHVSLDVAK